MPIRGICGYACQCECCERYGPTRDNTLDAKEAAESLKGWKVMEMEVQLDSKPFKCFCPDCQKLLIKELCPQPSATPYRG